MHLISIDVSPKQASRLRNGHKVRVKRGAGFNLIVSPSTYSLVTKAFGKNKGLEVQLSDEEIQANKIASPEQHAEMASEMDKDLFKHPTEGGSIFSKIKKALHSKTAKAIGKELKPFARIAKRAAKDIAHQKLAELHQMGAESEYGENPYTREVMNLGARRGHEMISGLGLGKFIHKAKKALYSKEAKKIGRQLKPFTRALKGAAKDIAHQKLAELHQMGAESEYGENPYAMEAMNLGARRGHELISGFGLGTGMGTNIGAHQALKLANMGTAKADYMRARMHNRAVHGQLSQPSIKRHYDDEFAPPSRGYGLHNHHNLIRGRGSMLAQDDILPQALQSQPYGANWHMQFFLPPQYHKFNDGGESLGRGLYI